MVKRIPIIPERTQWVNFVRNLDELNINKLPKDQQERIYDVFGKNKSSHIYDRGLRRRVAPMLNNRKKPLELIFALLFGLPGTPLICYGDEIGMGEDLVLPERASVRTPMQWSADKNAGFSTIASRKTILPVISFGRYSYKRVNVEQAKKDQKSLYTFIKNLIQLHKTLPILGNSRPDIWPTSSEHILAFHYHWKGKKLIALYNLSNKKQTFDCQLEGLEKKAFREILKDQSYEKHRQFDCVTLGAYGFRWFYHDKS
jgi:maltose alpha-D-glucosyltransferase/alpha-amylase